MISISSILFTEMSQNHVRTAEQYIQNLQEVLPAFLPMFQNEQMVEGLAKGLEIGGKIIADSSSIDIPGSEKEKIVRCLAEVSNPLTAENNKVSDRVKKSIEAIQNMNS